jgi:hypothetical protein
MKLTEQPKPERSKNSKIITTQLVFSDPLPILEASKREICKILNERLRKGFKNYGVHLCTFNGRDAVQDLIEEISDAVLYLEQAIEETNNKFEEIEKLIEIKEDLFSIFERILELKNSNGAK